MSILKTLFDFRSGELERVPYLLYSLVSLLIMVVGGGLLMSEGFEGIGWILFLPSAYITFTLSVQRVRHIGLESPILLVLSFFALMTLTLFVMPLNQVNQAGNSLSEMGGGATQIIPYVVFLLWGVPGAFLDKKPFRILFCDAKTGELRRLPYFGYLFFVSIFLSLLLYLVLLPFQMLMMFSSSSVFAVLVGLVAIVAGLVYGISSFYATAVLMIKRMRNIGFKRPILYFWLYMAFVFGVLGVLVLHAVMTLDFTILKETKDIGPLVPYLIWGGIYYLLSLGFSLFVLFAPEGTLNSSKKLKK